MDAAFDLTALAGALLLAAGLVFLVWGRSPGTVWAAFAPGLALLGLYGANLRDVTLLAGLALAAGAVALGLARDKGSAQKPATRPVEQPRNAQD